MKKIIRTIQLILICLFSFSCKYDFNFFPREYDIETRSPGFTHLEGADAPVTQNKNKFSVLVIGDTHFGRDGWFKPKRDENPFYAKLEEVAQALKTQAPILFGINVGDNSDSGKQSEFDTNTAFSNTIKTILKNADSNADGRIFSIVGNHDLYNDGWENWKKNCYPHTSTYYFETTGTGGTSLSWYFLDSGSGMIGTNQMNQFEALAAADSNKKFVFSHYPVNAKNVTYYSLSNPLEIAKLNKIYYQNNIKLGIEGHFHPGGSNDIQSDSGAFKFHEEVVSGFVDRKAFYILTVDLGGSEPSYSLQKYTF